MKLEEYSKYLDEEIINIYDDISFGDKSKSYGLIIELTNKIPYMMKVNKKNRLILLKNYMIYVANNIVDGDYSLRHIFSKTNYILKTQYKCYEILSSKIKENILFEELGNIYLYFNILNVITEEAIKYCDNATKQYVLAHKGIIYIPNDKIDIDENEKTIEKVLTSVKKIKSIY